MPGTAEEDPKSIFYSKPHGPVLAFFLWSGDAGKASSITSLHINFKTREGLVKHFTSEALFLPEWEENLSGSFLKNAFLSSTGQEYTVWPGSVARKAGGKGIWSVNHQRENDRGRVRERLWALQTIVSAHELNKH